MKNRPYVTVILAMSADGKIADASRSAARFQSTADRAHLEAQVAQADATLFGAGTLRAYGTTLPVTDLALIAGRQFRHQPNQPIQIVCSATGNLDPQYRFFQQPVPRWLITTLEGMQTWRAIASNQKEGNQKEGSQKESRKAARRKPFEHVFITERPFNWHKLMQDLRMGKRALSAASSRLPIENLLVMGGGELIASLLSDGLVDELYLTICPLLIGGKTAPTPVGGLGFRLPKTPQLKLQSSWAEGDEVFLHYRVTNRVIST